MLTIHSLFIPETMDSTYIDFFQSILPIEKRRNLAKFRRKEDFYRSLLGEILIRGTITEHTNLTNEEIRYSYNPYGKPFLENNPNFLFNISHAGNWVVILWGQDSRYIGIDIEKITPIDLSLAKNLFSPQENHNLLLKKGEEQLTYFYQLWTLKESYVKALGKGLSIPLDSFSFAYEKEKGWHSPEVKDFYFQSYPLDSMYCLSACANTNNLPDHVQPLTIKELFARLK